MERYKLQPELYKQHIVVIKEANLETANSHEDPKRNRATELTVGQGSGIKYHG